MVQETHTLVEKIMTDEIPILIQMNTILEKKEQEIIKGNLPGIIQLDQELEEAYSRMRELELKRIQCLELIHSNRLSLSEIVEQCHWPNQPNMMKLITKIKSIINGIKKRVNSNRILLEQSIKWIDYSVNSIIKASMPQEVAYTKTGKVTEYNLEGLISINQVV